MSFRMKYNAQGDPEEVYEQPIAQPAEAALVQQPVVEKMTAPEVQEPVQVETAPLPEPAPVQIAPEPINNVQMNFAQLRDKAERAERDKRELEERLRRMEMMQYEQRYTAPYQPVPGVPTQQPQQTPQQFNLNPDDLVEGRHISEIGKELQSLRQEIEKTRQQTQSQIVTNSLKQKYSDFDEITSKENCALLREVDPIMADMIVHYPDMYGKGVKLYESIKKIKSERNQYAQQQDQMYQNQQRLTQNAAKPKNPASISASQGYQSPLASASAYGKRDDGLGLTEEAKKAMRAEQYELRKRS